MSIIQRVLAVFGRKTQIPQPPDDGFRPSTFSEGYGTTGNSHEAGDADAPVRCESRKREGSRSWRCSLPAGHESQPVWPLHVNASARRSWA